MRHRDHRDHRAPMPPMPPMRDDGDASGGPSSSEADIPAEAEVLI
jgi:hypothetical protein